MTPSQYSHLTLLIEQCFLGTIIYVSLCFIVTILVMYGFSRK
jgi:hypothetical protein